MLVGGLRSVPGMMSLGQGKGLAEDRNEEEDGKCTPLARVVFRNGRLKGWFGVPETVLEKILSAFPRTSKSKSVEVLFL